MKLTNFVLKKVAKSSRTGTVKKHWEADKINELWAETPWAKKLAMKEKVSD